MSPVEIPLGLKELLHGYTAEVLRLKPADLVEFAVEHFTRIQEGQRKEPNAKEGSVRTSRSRVSFRTHSDEGLKDEKDSVVGEYHLKQFSFDFLYLF
jgi:hypothetical protein